MWDVVGGLLCLQNVTLRHLIIGQLLVGTVTIIGNAWIAFHQYIVRDFILQLSHLGFKPKALAELLCHLSGLPLLPHLFSQTTYKIITSENSGGPAY